MPSRCSCPKWFNKLSLDVVYTLMYRYLTHPEYGARFSIHQLCFMCANEDRIEKSAIDEFTARELFGDLPHPEMLNLHFVGAKDSDAPPAVMPERVSVSEIIMNQRFRNRSRRGR